MSDSNTTMVEAVKPLAVATEIHGKNKGKGRGRNRGRQAQPPVTPSPVTEVAASEVVETAKPAEVVEVAETVVTAPVVETIEPQSSVDPITKFMTPTDVAAYERLKTTAEQAPVQVPVQSVPETTPEEPQPQPQPQGGDPRFWGRGKRNGRGDNGGQAGRQGHPKKTRPATPARNIPEVARHADQILNRNRKKETSLFGLAAYSLSPSVQDLEFKTRIMPIGMMTHFVQARRWRQGKWGRMVVIRFIGYKARLTEEGRIQLGGPEQAVCGYDLKFPPFVGASKYGAIIDASKRTTLLMGLDMDAAIELVNDGQAPGQQRLDLPDYLAGFVPGKVVDVEDTAAVRRVVLDYLRPSYDGPAPACCVSPGGVVAQVEVRPDDHDVVFVRFEGIEPCFELPGCAVLRPFVQVGAQIEAGTVIADMAPKTVYQSWEQLKRAVGDVVLGRLREAVVAARDLPHLGLVLRDVRFCPSQLLAAKQIFERADVTEGQRAPVQVVDETGQGRNSLKFTDGPIDVNFDAIRSGWEKRFE